MNSGTLGWRYFLPGQIREALMWAGKGGVSVYEPSAPENHLPSARLLARDRTALHAAARELGIGPEFVQVKRGVRAHFVLMGECLYNARARCRARLRKG